jgi:ABC-type lipoprotein release transport system permease subunit
MGRGVFGGGTTLRPAALGIAALACALVAGLASILPLRRAFRVQPASVLKGE